MAFTSSEFNSPDTAFALETVPSVAEGEKFVYCPTFDPSKRCGNDEAPAKYRRSS
jgi:hypothetical protein